MAAKLELSSHLDTFVTVPESMSAIAALDRLHEAQAIFAVFEHAGCPIAVLRPGDLTPLAAEGERPIADLADRLPSLLVIDARAELYSEDLVELACILQRTGASGGVVYADGQIAGVLSSQSIAEALPLDAVIPYTAKRLYGSGTTPIRVFVCRMHAPPVYRCPRQGSEPPICPANPSHGAMKRE